jgi:hypothetical protein
MCAGSPNNIDGATAGWQELAKAENLSSKVEASATQVFNPSTGKGTNRAKAMWSSPGGQQNFWLVEYLKLIGMRHAGLPRVVSGAKDRKTYVLLPVNIALNTSNRVFELFNQALWPSSAVKMDILAALRYARVFLEQWQDGQLDRLDAMFGGQPDDHVSGLAVDEKRGLEYELLQTYRDFLSTRDLRHFFEFTAAYSSHLSSKIEHKEPIKQFTTNNLEVLIMTQNKKLKPILESEGFQNVAYAIRQSTVIPQRAKASGKERVYDIRYGLGNDLKRKANYNEEFVQALTDFMHSYNQENAQVEENYKGNPPYRRKQLTTTDIDEVVALIDEHNAKTVGNMLVAFGYARAPREDEQAKKLDT